MNFFQFILFCVWSVSKGAPSFFFGLLFVSLGGVFKKGFLFVILRTLAASFVPCACGGGLRSCSTGRQAHRRGNSNPIPDRGEELTFE